jgi:DNA repair exonuclease SbcCD ATPase subunit
MLNSMRKSPFKIFLRAKNYEPVGILAKKEHRYDSAWGQMRIWAVGMTLGEDGKSKKFEEPLDRKNRRTGELEDLIQMETDLLIITARNSADPDDDNDANFQYIVNPHSANRLKDNADRIKERDRILQDLQKKLDETEHSRDYFQREADTYGSDIRNLKQRISNLSEKLSHSEQQAEHYRTLLKKDHIGSLEEEGALDELMGGARKRGAFEKKDSAEVILEAAKKQKDAQKFLTNLGMGQMSPEFATKGDLMEIEKKIMQAISTVATVRERQNPQRPASQGDIISRKPPEEEQ